MGWFYLILAGLLEIIWAVGIKYTIGFTKLMPSVITIVSMVLSVLFLSLSLKTLSLGTAYAVWTGIGTIGTALFGIILFNESSNIIKILFICLIIIGIAGLKLTSES
jgi:quaternary ammonium compound-resistance protein SugE